MSSQEALQELVSYETEEKDVLSLYLNTDNAQRPIDAIKLQVKGMLKEVQPQHPKDASAIETYLNHSYDWTTPGLAIFSSEGGDFFRAFPVAVPFRNRLRVGHKPYVKPLAHFLDYYAHYGVIMIDQVGARFYEFHLGELQASDGFLGEDVHKLKDGGGSSAVGMRGGQPGARREGEVAGRNLREAAAEAAAFFADRPIRRLFLGGTDETVAQFQEMLPKKLRSCVAGAFNLDMNAGAHQVRDLTLQLLRQANEEREEQLVQEMVTTAAKGGAAVLGLDDTLQAISDKRARVLVVSDGYKAPGYMHENSGFLVANMTKSPLSEEELTPVDDVVGVAASYTLEQGGRIEMISDNEQLEEAGHIGAILHY